MLLATTSERQGRIIDRDAGDGSMEKKKQEAISDGRPRAPQYQADERELIAPTSPLPRQADLGLLRFIYQRRRWQVDPDRRLLYETRQIFDDQMTALEADSKRVGTQGNIDFALLVDGLTAERSRASRSTSPIASSRRRSASSSSPTLRVTSNIPATW